MTAQSCSAMTQQWAEQTNSRRRGVLDQHGARYSPPANLAFAKCGFCFAHVANLRPSCSICSLCEDCHYLSAPSASRGNTPPPPPPTPPPPLTRERQIKPLDKPTDSTAKALRAIYHINKHRGPLFLPPLPPPSLPNCTFHGRATTRPSPLSDRKSLRSGDWGGGRGSHPITDGHLTHRWQQQMNQERQPLH